MSPSKATSSSDGPVKGNAVDTQAEEDDDQTKPHTFDSSLSQADEADKADEADEADAPVTKSEDPPYWSERERQQAAHDDAATSAYQPVATPPGYGAMGPAAAAAGGYGGAGGYPASGGYVAGSSVPPQQPLPPQVTPVSRSSAAARRARLKVSHLGPLSVLRVSLTFSLCMFIVLLVAVAALWGVLDSSGVFKSIINAATTLTNDKNQTGIAPWLTFGRVMLITVVIGAANVIAFTLLSTIGALLYNLCSDFVGGVEVTLIER